jgi:UDP-N-acetylmuramoylalanine--D-glutamate ligase
LSSFQLDDIIQFKADVAVLLNITPDHLDRYDYDFSKYVKSKFRITENQGEEDVLIYNDLDPVLFEEWKHFAGKQKTILLSQDTYNADQLSTDNRYFFEIKNFSLKGRHNQLNALCAIHIAQTLGIANETIQASLLSYSNFPHRMENVGIWKGISFINDSKATNVDAVYYALDAMRKPVVWIAGGTDKGNEYEALFPVVEGKVKCLICLGLDSEKLKEAFKGRINTILETKEIEEAVQMAIESAEVGDVILLSPACASFDLFNNYEHRGNAFKKEVSKYIKRIK